MTTTLSNVAEAYVRAVNDGDADGFIRCFSENAVVDDASREFRGISAIKDWSDREIFAVQVRFEVLDVAARDGETIVTTKVEGNYDKTGLPDPLVMDHRIVVEDEKIASLTIRLAEEK